MDSQEAIEAMEENTKPSRKYKGNNISESSHVLVNMTDKEVTTKCSDAAYCSAWGHVWVSIATPMVLFAIIVLIVWTVISVCRINGNIK